MLSSWAGLRQGWNRERAIRCHLLSSLAGVALLILVDAPALGLLSFLFFLAPGLAAELINAAIEALLDTLHPAFHAEIGAAKDMGSAAAFILNAAAVAAFVCALWGGLAS